MPHRPIPIRDVFDTHRFPSYCTMLAFLCYLPFGIIIFLIRLGLGVQTFIVACVLRKATTVRHFVLRSMCALLGIVVHQGGTRAPKVKMLCANHVSALDHLAVDLVESCILPSVWDIPGVLRCNEFPMNRCFGYANFGVSEGGRPELVRQARNFISKDDLPLLAFPEGAITNGRVALLQFSTWPMEVSNQIQPVAISVWRPIDVRVALIDSAWYWDVFHFILLPFTFIHVEWLPVLTKNEDEPLEDFAARVSKSIADYLDISTSNISNRDAVDAAKRHAVEKQFKAVTKNPRKVPIPSHKLDEMAMKIKRAHPGIPIYAIRKDLDMTLDTKETVERIKACKLTANTYKKDENVTNDPMEWKGVFAQRKWDMIEKNRAIYLERARAELAELEAAAMAAGDRR